jgi:hypothetical protein
MHRGEVMPRGHDAQEPGYLVDIGFRPVLSEPPKELVQRRIGLRQLPMRRARALFDRNAPLRLKDRDGEFVVSH